jgi:hypothetical protein
MLAEIYRDRYAVIGWLLNFCHTTAEAQNAKLALFLDWFAYVYKVTRQGLGVECGI